MYRALVIVGLAWVAAGSARAQDWSEPDPAGVVGHWSGTVTRKQCATAGDAKIALDVVRDGSGYQIDLGVLLEGLRAEAFAPIGGAAIEASRDDLHATWTAGKLDRAVLEVALGGGCRAVATLRRDSLGVAACDEVVGLRAVAAACPTLAAPVAGTAAAVLGKLQVGRKVSARQRTAAEATCRREATPLRAGLIEAGCVPAPADPHAGPPIAECNTLIETVVRAMRCDRVPADMKQRLAEQVHILAHSARVAEPEARAVLVEQCKLTNEEIVETLKLVGCK